MKRLIISAVMIILSNTVYAEQWQKITTIQGQDFYIQSDAIQRVEPNKIETRFKRQDQDSETISAVRLDCSARSMLTTQIIIKNHLTGKTHVLNSDIGAKTYFKIPNGTAQAMALNKVCQRL